MPYRCRCHFRCQTRCCCFRCCCLQMAASVRYKAITLLQCYDTHVANPQIHNLHA